MSQTQLAKIIQISNVTICRYVNGQRTPRLEIIAKIASALNVSSDYLLGLTDDKNATNSNENLDTNFATSISKLFSLEENSNLSKRQIELIKKLLLANKDFILSA